MAGNRKAAEASLLADIETIMPGGPTPAIYKSLFASMDDQAFDDFVMRIANGEIRPAIIAPVMFPVKLTVKRNLATGEAWGHDFYQRIWMAPGEGIPTYLTNKKYLVVDLPWRRQAQVLEKKVRIPKHNRSIDDLTGQPSGESKGSKISYPEVQVLAALDLPHSLTEMMKYRGGDIKGFDAMTDAIDKHGAVSMASIEHLAGGVESTKTLSTFLTAMHLSNTLLAKK